MILKVATFNLFAIPFHSDQARERLIRIKRLIAEGPWDLVGLQEDYFWKRSSRWSQLPYHVVTHDSHGILGTGNTQLTKLTPLKTQFTVFKTQGPSPIDLVSGKGVGVVHLEWQGEELIFINTHLMPPRNSFSHKIRKVQMDQMGELMTKLSSKAHKILVGDFNVTPDEEGFKYWHKYSGLSPASYEGHSFCSSNTFNQNGIGAIDHIWISPQLIVERAQLALTEKSDLGINLSDHYMVEANIRIRKP